MWITCSQIRKSVHYGNPVNRISPDRSDGCFAKRKMAYVNKKIHIQRLKVFPNLNVDNVDKLRPEKMFADIYNVSGTHGYQQITVYTIF